MLQRFAQFANTFGRNKKCLLVRTKPWERLFHWVHLVESHRIFYKNTVIGIEYLNSKKAFEIGVSLVSILLLPMVSQAYYFTAWEKPGRNILTDKIQFPFKNHFTPKAGYAVGGHYVVSHILLCTYSIAVWF